MPTGIMSALKACTIYLNLVPSTGNITDVIGNGCMYGPFITPTPTPMPTLLNTTMGHISGIGSIFSNTLPSWADSHVSLMPSFPALNLSGSLTSTLIHVPQVLNARSIGLPSFMGMNLLLPAGFISFIGFLIAILLSLWAICGLAFRGSFWYLTNGRKK